MKSFEELELITPETYSGLTKKQKKILCIWYDNCCEGPKEVAEQADCSPRYVYKLVSSELGISYINWRKSLDGPIKIKKEKIIEEYKNMAFANFDDCYEVVVSYDEETEEKKYSYEERDFAKIPRRERRRIKSAISREDKCFKMNYKAKMEALGKLADLSGVFEPESVDNDFTKEKKSIMSRIKKHHSLLKKEDE